MRKMCLIFLLVVLALTGCSKPYPKFEGALVLRDDYLSRSVIMAYEHAEEVDDLVFFFKGVTDSDTSLYVGNTQKNGEEIRANKIELPTEITDFTLNDWYLNDDSYQKFYIKANVDNSQFYYTVQWDYEEYSGKMYFDCYKADSDETPASLIVNSDGDIYIYESNEHKDGVMVVEQATLLFQQTSYAVENNVRNNVYVFAYTKDNQTYLSTCQFENQAIDLKTVEISSYDDCGFQKVLTQGFFYTISERDIKIYNFNCEEVLSVHADNDIYGVFINSYGDYFINYAEKKDNSFIIKRQLLMKR